jgi:ribosomal protein S18 acetylase RimI-like enzyme
MSESPRARVFLALDEQSTPVGFAACAVSTPRMYRDVLLRHGLCFAWLLAGSSLRPERMRAIAETVRYGIWRGGRKLGDRPPAVARPPHQDVKSPQSELLAIAVRAGRRGERIGWALVNAVDEHIRRQGTGGYKVVSYSLDGQANGFYQACGFRFRREFVHHGKVMYEYSKSVG